VPVLSDSLGLMTIRIVKREPLERGLRRIAREQADAVIADLANPALTLDIQVHNYRKSCKRLRALLRLKKDSMGPVFKAEDVHIRDAARAFSHLRDAHVLAETLALFTGEPVAPQPEGPVERAARREALRHMRAIRIAIEGWPIRARGFEDLAPGFARTYGTCRAALAEAKAGPSDHSYHRFRRWAKHHLYQVNMLELANRAWMRERGLRLKALGEALGVAHDMAVLQTTLETGGSLDAGLPPGIEQRKQELYAQALALSDECLEADPEDFVAALARWWKAWRG